MNFRSSKLGSPEGMKWEPHIPTSMVDMQGRQLTIGEPHGGTRYEAGMSGLPDRIVRPACDGQLGNPGCAEHVGKTQPMFS